MSATQSNPRAKSRGLSKSGDSEPRYGVEVELSLDSIDASPYQPASRQLGKRDVEDLMATIKSNGQLQPILASATQDGRYVVHSGHRRCAALRFLGASSVRAIVREVDDREARRLVVGDNLGRRDLSAIEKAEALAGYAQAYELSLEAAAEELGVKARTAYRLKVLLDASPDLQELFARAQIPARPAATLTKLEARDPAKARRLAVKYAEGAVNANDLDRAAKPGGQKKASSVARKIAEVKANDLEVRLAVNLTRRQIETRAAAVTEAANAVAEFLRIVGHQHFAAVLAINPAETTEVSS